MHLEVFVEEPSAEAALRHLLPRILVQECTWRFHAFQGKPDLLGKLPARLRAYAGWPPATWRVLVLIDEDGQDCQALKAMLDGAAEAAGLVTKSGAGSGPFQVLNRLAIEELEAWFLGDVDALCHAYPGVPPTLGRRRGYRDPDAVTGGTWESLERVLRKAGYYAGGMPKIEVADKVASHMDPDRNRSHSFGVLVDGLRELVRRA